MTWTDQGQSQSATAKDAADWCMVLEERGEAAPRTALRFGNSLIALDEITKSRLVKQADLDVSGQHFNAALYVSLAACLGFAVLEAGWRWQFYAGVILFTAIAGMALCDVLTARRIRYYRLFLETSSGDTRCYTTARAADAQRLIKRLAQKGIRTDIAAIQQS